MKKLFILILFIAANHYAHAQSSYYANDGVAIKGYDPVAYFSDGVAAAGSKQVSYVWAGTEWHFTNEKNRDTFKSNPEKYAPQFGGYCAYGASRNYKAPTDPLAFTIVDEKLYLNYNPKVKEIWMKDTKAYIEKAEMNWITLKDSK